MYYGTPGFISVFTSVCHRLQYHSAVYIYVLDVHCRVKTERDGTRAETKIGLPAKRTSPFISAGVSVQSSTGFLGVRVGGERL